MPTNNMAGFFWRILVLMVLILGVSCSRDSEKDPVPDTGTSDLVDSDSDVSSLTGYDPDGDAAYEAGQGANEGAAAPHATQVGEYLSVPAYSNGDSHGLNGPYEEYGWQYQCVEYANRFMTEAMGFRNLRGSGNAKDYWSPNLGLDQIENGGSCPCPNDLIVSQFGDYGHIAVVRATNQDHILVIQQNWANNERDGSYRLNMTRTEGRCTVEAFGGGDYTIAGWLRIPGEACEDITHDGYFSTLSLEGDSLLVEGKVWAKEGIDLYTVSVGEPDDYPETSDPNLQSWTVEGGATEEYFSAVITLSDSDLVDGDHEVGLWLKDTDGVTQRVAVDGPISYVRPLDPAEACRVASDASSCESAGPDCHPVFGDDGQPEPEWACDPYPATIALSDIAIPAGFCTVGVEITQIQLDVEFSEWQLFAQAEGWRIDNKVSSLLNNNLTPAAVNVYNTVTCELEAQCDYWAEVSGDFTMDIDAAFMGQQLSLSTGTGTATVQISAHGCEAELGPLAPLVEDEIFDAVFDASWSQYEALVLDQAVALESRWPFTEYLGCVLDEDDVCRPALRVWDAGQGCSLTDSPCAPEEHWSSCVETPWDLTCNP